MLTHAQYDVLGESIDARSDGLAAPQALGLSYVTYLTAGSQPGWVMDVAAEGRAARLIPTGPDERGPRVQKGGGRRAEIKEFSRQSRMRLLWQLAQLQKGAFAPALFITLTYPAGTVTPRESKHHLDVWLKRVRRRWPEAAGFWKMEYQKNGTVHYHVILMGLAFWLHRDVKTAWAEVVKSEHPDHERMGAHVDLVASQRQAACYMGKYVAKDQGRIPENHYGRLWGRFGNLERFSSRKVVVGLDRAQVVQLRRVFDAIRRARARHRPFRRASDLGACQRWFIEGESALNVMERLFGVGPPAVCARAAAGGPLRSENGAHLVMSA